MGALLALAVWAEVLGQAVRRHPVPRLTPFAVVVVGLGTQCLACALEAVLARAVWRAQGVRLAWAALVTRIVTVSVCEAGALAVVTGSVVLPAAWAIALAGPRAGPDVLPADGWATATASVGLLSELGVLVSAQAQAALAGASFARGLGVVAGLWLASRLVLWWTSDLVLGGGPAPWR
ncbi:MAG: hypothetical protein ACKOC6_06195 [bacterium]